jgi:endonuclease YncB( thermonuclease family)
MTRRFRRRPPPWFWLLLLLAAAILARWRSGTSTESPALAAGEHVVTAVLDGRTLQVEPGTAVRLLGVTITDKAAAREYLQLNVVGQSVRTELDKRRRASDGSHFAYVYLGRIFVNAELVRQGWAKHDDYPGDSASHAKILREAKAK